VRIGVYGGSFDPPHRGHEALARLALAQFGLDRLLVVPAGTPVHRTLSGHADGELRRRWLTRIFADDARIAVVDWELAEPSPTIASLRRFAQMFPHATPLLLMGADAVAAISGWVEYPAHRSLCNLGLFARTGEAPLLPSGWGEMRVQSWKRDANGVVGRLLVATGEIPAISATMVREAAQSHRPLAELVPDCIVRDIAHYYDK